MAQRTASNLLRLAILSLLSERPMHPYEIAGVMRLRELDRIIKVSQSSLYSAIEALVREGLIAVVETQRAGRYPERTLYATTTKGRAELTLWLRTLLQAPSRAVSPFAVGLAFMAMLPPDEVALLFAEHARALEEQIAEGRATIARGQEMGVDRVFLVEDAYGVALLETRLNFVRQVIEGIEDGTLTEQVDGERRWKVLRPDLALLQAEGGEH